MGGKKAAGENSKKAAGNARKAEAAASKKAVEDQKRAAEEDKQWAKGAKGSTKKDDAEAKKAEAARKKAERDALLAEEEASQPSKPKNTKSAGKKNAAPSKGTLDLSQLDDKGPSTKSALNASGIDNALDALSLTGRDTGKIDRHPERRFKAAYAAFEARRLPEIEEENPGLRRNQRIELVKKEFEKSDENPFNQVHVAFDASREEIAAVKDAERKKVETRLTK
ncbi:hypothetical protein ASPVEDRAFT_36474 [Aspergillus versicolor CBS 583.65]|uniref:DUF1014 domain protein n=1 Tax=Aspergillus versicolor CBS 583.65 TaxID=1036611 RepID=A0A1L9P6G3_ASPVE|nr:uncharacterized protein ASPVEDRAFT_36474 [Aspergillus versicolor CBS 583.65]OJI97082.1 hypothetical protein ASPVEDRAFT_36474 [Aspergillus versicolor CBS 583.65]